jgi:hypothetical protein
MLTAFLAVLVGVTAVSIAGLWAALNVRKKSTTRRMPTLDGNAVEFGMHPSVTPQSNQPSQEQTPDAAKVFGFAGGSQQAGAFKWK